MASLLHLGALPQPHWVEGGNLMGRGPQNPIRKAHLLDMHALYPFLCLTYASIVKSNKEKGILKIQP